MSFLPTEAFAYEVPRHEDPRGSFVEMLKTESCGQFSYFTAHPGVTAGQHYHHSKTEKFLVISGDAALRFRHVADRRDARDCARRGARPVIVETVPGWTHDITNVGDEEMIVMLWANEVFDRQPTRYLRLPALRRTPMKKLKVMTVVGTRPEIIRLSRVMARLDEHCEHVLVHTGQNYDYELNEVFFDDLGVRKPDHFLDSAAGSDSAAHTIGNVIIAVDRVLAKESPEALLVLGDTNSCLAVIPAKRRKIPIFHMEAGNRCFDQRVPEEINRRIVDHTADVNLTYSSIAREYLLREGLPPDLVIKTGSPMFEVLNHYRPRIDASDVLQRLGLDERRLLRRQRPPRGEHRFAEIVRQAGRRAERRGRRILACRSSCRRIRAPRSGWISPASSFHPQRPAAEAAGFPRLRRAADVGAGGAVGQRHDHRGVVDPEFSGAEHPRGARAPGGHGGGGRDDGGAGGRSRAAGAGDPRQQPGACESQDLRLVDDYCDAERVGQGRCASSTATRTT